MSEADEDGPEPTISGAAFWALMDRWTVPHDVALRMISGPPMTATGRRPRFKLRGEQVKAYTMLRAIDDHLVALNEQAFTWIDRPIGGQPFRRKRPIALLEQGPAAVAEVLRHLQRQTFSPHFSLPPWSCTSPGVCRCVFVVRQ